MSDGRFPSVQSWGKSFPFPVGSDIVTWQHFSGEPLAKRCKKLISLQAEFTFTDTPDITVVQTQMNCHVTDPLATDMRFQLADRWISN